jgi:hypothetical protein
MASPTGSSTGMMVSLAITSVLALALFITTIIFVAKVQRLTDDLRSAENTMSDAIRAGEMDDRWLELKSQAGGESVVRFLDNSLQGTMKIATGRERDTLEDLRTKMDDNLGDDSGSLLDAVAQRDREIGRLHDTVASEQRQRERIQNELSGTSDRVAELQTRYDEALAQSEGVFGKYTGDIDTYHSDLRETVNSLTDEVTRIQSDSDQVIAALQDEISEKDQKVLVLEDQLRSIRGDQRTQRLGARPEETHIDGAVIAIDSTDNLVYIDRGADDRLVIGLTFEVYDAGAVIRPDKDGEYPLGKATIEVVSIDSGSSAARVLRTIAGNPVVNGDTIVNPVYDPYKTYSFVVYGNFDSNMDGSSTAQESQTIRAIIEEWGGELTDEVSGDTDFLVLGTKPILPPEPKPDDPAELIQRFLRIKRGVRKYDEMFDQAVQTGIPVLNQNRLFTLTGLHARR